MALAKLDFYDKFMRAYEDGESKRSARSKLGLFLDDMGFKGQDFKGSKLKNEELKEAKMNDLRNRCNDFCKEFKERFVREGIEECQENLISYFDSLKQRAKEGKLDGGTIKNRKFAVKRLIEKVMKIHDSKGNGIDWEEVFNGLPKPSRFAQDRGYSIEEIRQICKYKDPRIKPIVYLFASSGIRLGAWDFLKWGHISPQKRNGKIVCALVEVYKDTPEQYPTIITVEAYNALKEWMDFRDRSGETITTDSWVMRDYWDTEKGFTHGLAREPEPLKSSGIKSLIDSAVRRQGLRKNLTNGKKRHDVQLNHAFRKFHETELIKANLKQVDINILQGHANEGMIDHYYRPSSDPNSRIDDYLINEFLKAEKYLTIEENNIPIEERETRLEIKYEKKILFIQFTNFIDRLLEVNAEKRLEYAKILADQNNGKLDRIIPAITLEPDKQLEYFLVSNEGRRLTNKEIDLLKKMIQNKEIQKVSLIAIDPDDYNKKFTDELDEKSGLPFLRI